MRYLFVHFLKPQNPENIFNYPYPFLLPVVKVPSAIDVEEEKESSNDGYEVDDMERHGGVEEQRESIPTLICLLTPRADLLSRPKTEVAEGIVWLDGFLLLQPMLHKIKPLYITEEFPEISFVLDNHHGPDSPWFHNE